MYYLIDKKVKIAILHEMLVKLGWAEKVVESWCKVYPDADIFTLIYDEKKVWKIFPKNKINTQVFGLFTQKTYNLTKRQRLCLPFMSKAVESLDFSDYDVVLCSSSAFAHWAITKPETKFIVYSHSPARYMWDWTNEYKKDIWWNKWIKWFILNRLFLKLRQWDFIASKRCDLTLANSKNTQNRITKYYRKDSDILYPPVEVGRFSRKKPVASSLVGNRPPPNPLLSKEGVEKNLPGNYYIIISALTEFKKIEVAVEWFNKLSDKNLIIVWEWNFRQKLEKKAWKNIVFTWAKYWSDLVSLVQNSNWLIFPGEEDFWIVPIEVMAAWKPVFSYRWGGLLETIIEWITWEFFDDKNWNDFVEKFKVFDTNNNNWRYTDKNCVRQAEKFSENKFEQKIKELVNM